MKFCNEKSARILIPTHTTFNCLKLEIYSCLVDEKKPRNGNPTNVLQLGQETSTLLTNIKVCGLDLNPVGPRGLVLCDIDCVRGLAELGGVVIDVQDVYTDLFDGGPLGRALVLYLDGEGVGGGGLPVQALLYGQ